MEAFFSKPATKIKDNAPPSTGPTQVNLMDLEGLKTNDNNIQSEQKPWALKTLSAAQIKEREERTIFVGNVT